MCSSTDRILSEGRDIDDEFARMLLTRAARTTEESGTSGGADTTSTSSSTSVDSQQQREQWESNRDASISSTYTSSAVSGINTKHNKSNDDQLSPYQWSGECHCGVCMYI